MVKFAADEKDKRFDPISTKTLAQIAEPAPPSPAPTDGLTEAPAVSRVEEPKAPAPKAKIPKKRSALSRAMRNPPKNERLDRVVKCLLTRSEEAELRQLVGSFAEAAETRLTLSHLIRPYFELLRHSATQLIEEFGRAKPERPINDRTALAYFEHQLAQIVHGALRKAPSYRADRSFEEDGSEP